jgi:hypothetical protein
VTLRQWHLRGIIEPEASALPEIFEMATDEAVVRALQLRPKISPDVVNAVREVQNASRMGWRLYTFVDIVRVEIMQRLLRHGVDPGRAGLIAQRCDVDQKLPNPRKVYITADGKEIKPQQKPAPTGKDHFAIVFEVNDGFKDVADMENPEDWWVQRSIFHFYGAENIPSQIESAHSDIFTHFDPDTCILLNLSAIERQVEAKLQAAEEAQ